MSVENPWELYSSVPGWEAASRALDNTWGNGSIFDHAIMHGMTLRDAANYVVRLMVPVMDRYSDFGANDTEPRAHLSNLIRRHIKRRYGVLIEVEG